MNTLETPQRSPRDLHPIETLPKCDNPTRVLERRKSIAKSVLRITGVTSLTILFACPFITLIFPFGEIPWNVATGLILFGFSLLCAGSSQKSHAPKYVSNHLIRADRKNTPGENARCPTARTNPIRTAKLGAKFQTAGANQ